jgi:predicted metalloprotease with PDZ domain
MKKLFISLLFLFVLFTKMTQTQDFTVNYTLGMPKPSSHYFEIEIAFAGINDEHLELILPVWRPGRYFIFDFASGVQEFKAVDGKNKELKFKKIDKCTWRVETGIKSSDKGNIKVSYRLYANEFNLRTRGLDDFHAFVNGTAVFMYSEKYRFAPLKLKVLPYSDWHITTGLENLNGNPFEFSAPDYDYFVDCPLEIGNQKDFTFEIDGREHVISIYGDADYDIEKIKSDFKTIIRKNFEFWGRVPYERYVFIVHCTPQSGGGTEHINSTVVGVKPSDFENENSYKNFLRLISHEFFHTWNVKQLKPKGLTPYNYTKENYTEELWIAEGGTSYYDGLILSRTGQYSIEDIYSEISRAVEENRRRPGNNVQSLAESSYDAWVKFWKRNPQSYNAETDYYRKGADVSLILDLEIRKRSGNNHSLDDVFRIMFEKFPLGVVGYTNDDFMNTCSELSGTSFNQFFDDYVYGTKPIDWEKFLFYAGLVLKSSDSTVIPVVGLHLTKSDGKVYIENVLPNSSAEDAGLSTEDEIIAVDGIKADYRAIEKRLGEMKSGEKVKLTVFKQNKLKDVTLTLQDRKIANYYIRKTENPESLQKEIFESWLGKKWNDL